MHQLSKDRKTDVLEDIIRHFGNQMHQDKDYTYTEASNETPTDNIKDTTPQNNREDTAIDCKVNPQTTKAVTTNAEDGTSSKSPNLCGQQAECRRDEHCDRKIRMWQNSEKPNRLIY